MSLTPGIRRTVAMLNEHGFHTTDSGDGVTNVAAGMDDALPYPNVAILVTPAAMLIAEALRLHDLIQARGICVEPMGEDPQMPAIQATFDPAVPDYGVIMLTGVDDAKLFEAP